MIIGEINDRITYSGFCIRFRPDKNKVLPLFLLYLFKSPQFRRHFSKSQQTSINNLNQDTLGSIILDLPDLHTQEKIVRCIHSITRKIEINKSINDNLQHQLKLMYDYWFTQFDFPDENGKPYRASGGAMVWCDELQREIPKGWKVSTLSDIAVLQAKSVMPQEGTAYNHYSIPAFDDTHSPAVEDGKAIASNKYVVPDNSVLVSKLNPQFKRIWQIIDSTDNAICSTEFLPVKATETGVYALYSLLCSDAFSVHLIQNASSSTGSRKRIDPDNCMSYKFPYDQKVFARFDKAIQPLLMKITGIPTETQALAALRDWLLPMLMNGQATISD
jgi:type I restriction enzyme S subunit